MSEPDDLASLDASQWEGEAELWLDPLGDEVQRSPCTLQVESDALTYTWLHEGTEQTGRIEFGDGSATFTDTWHQPDVMPCAPLQERRGLFQIEGRYGPELAWGWRIALLLREPTGQLVLQMTNIAPWGEEARAVRMTATRTTPTRT